MAHDVTNRQQLMDSVVNKLTNKLVDKTFKVLSLRGADLNSMTLAKAKATCCMTTEAPPKISSDAAAELMSMGTENATAILDEIAEAVQAPVTIPPATTKGPFGLTIAGKFIKFDKQEASMLGVGALAAAAYDYFRGNIQGPGSLPGQP